MQKNYCIDFALYDLMQLASIEMSPNVKLVWLETPGSVSMEISDLLAIAKIAHQGGIRGN